MAESQSIGGHFITATALIKQPVSGLPGKHAPGKQPTPSAGPRKASIAHQRQPVIITSLRIRAANGMYFYIIISKTDGHVVCIFIMMLFLSIQVLKHIS